MAMLISRENPRILSVQSLEAHQRMIAGRAGTLKEIEVGLVRRTLTEATLLSLVDLMVFRMEHPFRQRDTNTILLTQYPS